MIYKYNRDVYIPEERQSKQLKFLAFAYEGRYDIIRSALFEDDEARYEEACVLTNVEDFGAFCRIFSRLNYNCQNAQSKTIGANNNGCSNSKKPIISQDMKDLYRSGLSFLETFFLWIFCSVQQCEIICLVFSLLFCIFTGLMQNDAGD